MANTAAGAPQWHEVVIIGSGFSGIGAAIKLKQMGIADLVILEKAGDLGGTWRDNTYPGLTVDVASTSYSYAFEPNPDWSRIYAPGPEVKAYADHCADKYDVRRHIVYRSKVVRATYDAVRNLWTTLLEDGRRFESRYLVSATGLFGGNKMPAIDGIGTFAGKLMHTGNWDHSYDLAGRRVAVIGTGATAIQLIPEIVGKVAHLDVYQRTPIWLLPKFDGKISAAWKKAFRTVPGLQKSLRLFSNSLLELLFGIGFSHYKQTSAMYRWLEKQGVKHIRRQVKDPAIQDKLIPRYSFFCKRPSFSNVYFPVFNRDDVELVTEPITRISADAVITRDGTERKVDTLICATGFAVFEKGIVPAFDVIGKAGEELGDWWTRNRFQAFDGITVPGYPNFFMIFGPYAAASASWFGLIDTQVHHLARCLAAARRRGANYVEVRQDAHDADFRKMLKKRENQVLFHGNCALSNSYYYDAHGDAPLIRPVTQMGAWMRSRTFSLDNYEFAANGQGT